MSDITPSQTVGPYFAYGLTPKGRAQWDPNGTYSWKQTVGDNLVTPDATGQKIRIEGVVLDGDGLPIPDAMLEIWQADAQGRYAHPRDNRALPNTQFISAVRPRQERRLRLEIVKPARCRVRKAHAGAACRSTARHAAAGLFACISPTRRPTR
jgi:protocatechuate 3,4-dioxygenase beta subunit